MKYDEEVSNVGKITMEACKFAAGKWRNLVQNHEGSSTSHPTPLACIGKQKQGQGEVYTHFISLPLAIYPELKKNLEAFQNSVLGNNNDMLHEMGIEKSIFVSPKSLHLTVLMLKLGNKESLDAAQHILRSISSDVKHALNNRPVFVRLKGLDSMNGSLEKTRVLYVPVEEVGHEGRLLNACHIIIDAFVKAGFAAKDAKSRLKLHATVMNASYRKDKSRKMDSFDAREMYKKFGTKDWGKYLIREVHISKRFQYDPNGYFHCCGSLPFPLE